MEYPQKLKIQLPSDPVTVLLDSQKSLSSCHRNTYTSMLCCSTILNNQDRTILSVHQQINKSNIRVATNIHTTVCMRQF